MVEGGKVVRFVEKPQQPPSDLAIVGAYAFTPLLFRAAREVRPSFRGELELTDCLQWLVGRGHAVLPYEVRGWWQDVGRPGDLLVANRLLLARLGRRIEGEVDGGSRLEGAVVVEAGARVLRSHLLGPVVVRSGAVVEDSRVGPDVAVGPGAQVRASHVADSIVMDGARVQEVKGVRGFLVGRHARLAGEGEPTVFLGDHSEVTIPALGIEEAKEEASR
ncbi:MAG TPA: hypothetical protein ENN53_07350 [Candidatus Acetothermia bacterium]|nr:hypothetical protein [Candidatus Acetothermia bacterium]